jgi:hypothetical protein
MTEPSPTTEELLAARYGERSPRRRRLVIIVVGCLAVVSLAWLGWAAWVHSNPAVDGGLESFDVVSAHEVTVVITVRRDSGAAVECTVQARAADHLLVGDQRVTIPAGDSGNVRFVGSISTEREATTVTVTDCR